MTCIKRCKPLIIPGSLLPPLLTLPVAIAAEHAV